MSKRTNPRLRTLSFALAMFALPIMLSGCVVKTVADVITLPVKAGSKAFDMATTSQSESDEKRGRAMRQQEERLGKLDRQYRDAREDCDDGDNEACDRARDIHAQIREESGPRY